MILSKMKKTIVSLILTLTLVCCNTNICYASTKKTTSSSTCIDLSQSSASLSFQVTKLTYGNLFTNSTFKGASKVKVHIGSVTVDKNASASSIEDITVHLHKIGDSSLDVTADIDVPSGGNVYFTGLSTTAKYYLQFSKTNDGQIFSFSGSVVEN